MDVSVILGMLTAGAVLSWAFRKLGLSDVVGYVLGGVVISAILVSVGIDVKTGLSYIEPLRSLGLTLFSFTIGASIGFHRVIENIHRVVATELIVYAFLWMVSGFMAQIAHAGYLERTVLFITLVNSSTVATATLLRSKLKLPAHLVDRVVMQTSMEDLAQFALFTLMFVAGISIVQDFFRALVQLFTIVGVSIILVMVARYVLTFLSRTKFVSDRENKFVMVVGIAILFASVASVLGLPPLFGTFLAGTSFSVFLSLDDVLDMVNGVKSLGLLLYFTSLGAQLYLIMTDFHGGLNIVLVGATLGVVAFFFRAVSASLAMLFTGSSVSESVSLALFLTPLSEMGIVFLDILAEREIVSTNLVAEIMIAVIISILLFGIITPRASGRTSLVERFVSPKISSFFKYLSDLYMRRTDVVISTLTPIIKFTSVSLLLVYVNSLALNIVEWLKLPLAPAVIISLASSITVFATFVLTLRNIFSMFLRYATSPIEKIREAFGKMLDLIVGSFAIIFQTYMFYEVSLRISFIEPLYTYATLVAGTVLVAMTFYELIKYYIKISRRK